MKEIVAVKFSDGTELEVRGIRDVRALARHIAALCLQDELRSLAAREIDWSTVSKVAEQRQARRLEKKEKKRRDAAKPRNKVTKAELIAFKYEYEMNNGATHGWQRAACDKLLIDQKTLKKRMAD